MDTSEGEQENIKRTRTKKEQFDLIVSFYEKYNEELLEPKSIDHLWTSLSDRLNDLGPPVHTIVEWRRIWTDHKYNKKRKRRSTDSGPEALRTMVIGNSQNNTNFDQLPHSNQQLGVLSLDDISFVCNQPVDDIIVPSMDNITFVFAHPEAQPNDNATSKPDPVDTGVSCLKEDSVLVGNNTIKPNDGDVHPIISEVDVIFRSEVLHRLDVLDEKLDTLIKLSESNNLKRDV